MLVSCVPGYQVMEIFSTGHLCLFWLEVALSSCLVSQPSVNRREKTENKSHLGKLRGRKLRKNNIKLKTVTEERFSVKSTIQHGIFTMACIKTDNFVFIIIFANLPPL